MRSGRTGARSGRTSGSSGGTGRSIVEIGESCAGISASCAVTSVSALAPIAPRDPEVALVVEAAVGDNGGFMLNA